MPETRKAVVLLSGGMDSATLLWWALHDGYEVFPLSADYGQRHNCELLMARQLVEIAEERTKLCHAWRVAPLRSLAPLLAGSALTSPEIDVPDGHYEDESMRATVVPNRNMILLAVAAGHAISRGADTVLYAAHAGDHAVYPDCRPAFYHAMGDALAVCHYSPVVLRAPFGEMTKAEIVTHGERLGVPYEHTWSCYKGGVVHCGTCGTCTERKEAFALACVADPTVYQGHATVARPKQ